jgi:hypothetical protein
MRAAIITALLIFFSAQEFYAAPGAETRRFALIVAANNGGPDREILRYAHSDAASITKTLTMIGGMNKSDCTVLYDPDSRILKNTINSLSRSISQAKRGARKTEFIFYYSGHSDEEGLMLGREKIPYAGLRKDIFALPADVRIVILDSCSSGAFTQLKGGKHRPAFMTDRAFDMKGNAVMTSSSRSEYSQESERIRGSFFTHYLITGLRGAADVNQDNRITLNEAYQYAFNNTLRHTENTAGGPQHPNYNIQMSGTGDVILTDISRSSGSLVMTDEMSGRVALYSSGSTVAAEVYKPYGREMRLALPAGKYTASYERDGRAYESAFEVTEGEPVSMSEASFAASSSEMTALRGGKKEQNQKPENKTGRGETLLDTENLWISGYGGIETAAVFNGSAFRLLSGGRGGVLLNNWTIGGRGCGLVYPTRRSGLSGIDYTGELPDVIIGYGGLMTEYNFYPESMYSPSLGLTIGAGSISFMKMQSEDRDDNDDMHNAFFAFEPEVRFLVKVTRFFRVSAGFSYLFVSGMKNEEISSREISGPGISLNMSFGWF